MRNTLIVLSSILIVLQAFTIRQGTTENLKDIPWPFQVSDPIEWDV